MYAGAIMVVFVFVVMLLNLGRPDELPDIRDAGARIGAGFVAVALLANLLVGAPRSAAGGAISLRRWTTS